MSLIAYLCWLLGISTPSECNANSYESFLTGSCNSTEEGSVETPSQQGEQQHPQRQHSQRTNIDVSI
jgi:hypothetical protein